METWCHKSSHHTDSTWKFRTEGNNTRLITGIKSKTGQRPPVHKQDICRRKLIKKEAKTSIGGKLSKEENIALYCPPRKLHAARHTKIRCSKENVLLIYISFLNIYGNNNRPQQLINKLTPEGCPTLLVQLKPCKSKCLFIHICASQIRMDNSQEGFKCTA